MQGMAFVSRAKGCPNEFTVRVLTIVRVKYILTFMSSHLCLFSDHSCTVGTNAQEIKGKTKTAYVTVSIGTSVREPKAGNKFLLQKNRFAFVADQTKISIMLH